MKPASSKSHVGKVRESMEETQSEISRLFGYKPDAYADFMFCEACRWFRHRAPELFGSLSDTDSLALRWFRLKWLYIDAALLRCWHSEGMFLLTEDMPHNPFILRMWNEAHNAELDRLHLPDYLIRDRK